MDTSTFLSLVKGGIDHFSVEWQTDVKPAAAHRSHSLRKVSTATCMTGAEYANLAVNKDSETGALPWGEWSDYPYVVSHKGQDYARLYTVDGTVRTIYVVDGDVVDRDTFLSYLTPSQRETNRPKGGTITVKMDNLRKVK